MEPSLELYSREEGYLVNITPVYTPDTDTFSSNFKREIAHFVDCLANGTVCRNPVEDGVELMKILDAIYLSAKTGREVVIER
jgi:predicted dehydrogenase